MVHSIATDNVMTNVSCWLERQPLPVSGGGVGGMVEA